MMKTPHKDIEAEIFSLLERFEDNCDCEEWHIHGSTEKEDEANIKNTHTKEEWLEHKDFDIDAAKTAIMNLITTHTERARIDELTTLRTRALNTSVDWHPKYIKLAIIKDDDVAERIKALQKGTNHE